MIIDITGHNYVQAEEGLQTYVTNMPSFCCVYVNNHAALRLVDRLHIIIIHIYMQVYVMLHKHAWHPYTHDRYLCCDM